MLSIYEGLVEH